MQTSQAIKREAVLLQARAVTLNEEVNKEKSPMVGCWLVGQKKAVGDLTRMCHSGVQMDGAEHTANKGVNIRMC